MAKKGSLKKTFGVIKRSVFLRIFSIMNIVLMILIVAALINNSRFKDMIRKNKSIIEQNKITLQKMEMIIQQENAQIENKDYKLFASKSFAKYEEVIPFIALLESIFSEIDPETRISIMTSEEQIVKSDYADYKVNLKIGKNKALFLKAFQELYDSRFITKVVNFRAQWKDMSTEKIKIDLNELHEANFTIRLFLN